MRSLPPHANEGGSQSKPGGRLLVKGGERLCHMVVSGKRQPLRHQKNHDEVRLGIMSMNNRHMSGTSGVAHLDDSAGDHHDGQEDEVRSQRVASEMLTMIELNDDEPNMSADEGEMK